MSFSMMSGSSQSMNQNNDYEIPNAASDSISKLSFCPTVNYLASSSWDGTVRCWKIDIQQQGFHATPALEYKHSAPALCCAVTHDGIVISGGCDNQAMMSRLDANTPATVFGQHDAPIKEIFSSSQYNMVLTGSWDKTVKYWDVRSGNKTPLGTLNLPERVYAMDVRGHLAVVACGAKTIVSIDLRNPSKILHSAESTLKYQTRALAIFTDLSGYLVGSIEGRCAIEYYQAKGFAFKCHRDDSIYPVHSISIHPRYGTLSTSGGDGKFHYWDKDAKHRICQFKNCGGPVVSTAFNGDGTLFAYATSYDFACGPEPQYFDRSFGGHIYVHRAVDQEILQKDKRGTTGYQQRTL